MNPRAGSEPELDLSRRTLGDYRVLRKLGQGGMGQVYLAEQVSLRRQVALKVLRPEMADSEKALLRFRQEAEAVASINHPNIVQIYQIGNEGDLVFMALEYVEGRNLKDLVVRKGPPELPVALSIMRQVASALQRSGEVGIVHRDIKPENILVTRKVEVKVADFGLAAFQSDRLRPALDLTQSGQVMGTPLYMAPEQVEGGKIDPRTDIYSFGVTCYHLLSGRPPFTGDTAFEVALAHVRKQPEPLASLRPDLPEALCAVVAKMMAKSPDDRYQTAKDILRDVARVREGLSTAATLAQPLPVADIGSMPTLTPMSIPLPELTPEPAKKSRLRPWLVAAVVAASLVVAAGLGVASAWRERNSDKPMPGTEGNRPAVDADNRPSDVEAALKTLVEGVLKRPDAGGFDNCMKLGLLYLRENRLDEAAALFGRLEALASPENLRQLGKTGRAIVLALQGEATKSNALLREVFGTANAPKLKKDKDALPLRVAGYEAKMIPNIAPFVKDPQGREWLGKARYHNAANKVPESSVPWYLVYVLPMGAKGK